MGVLDDLHHEVCSLPLVEIQSEAVSQPFDGGFALEAGQTSPKHQASGTYQVLSMRPNCKERFDGQIDEKAVALRVFPSHQHHHFVVQFERIRLEFDTLQVISSLKIMAYDKDCSLRVVNIRGKH